jgi:uncharacterized OB-fold protein
MDLGIVRADARSVPFFEAAARDELLVKRCSRCGRWFGPEATGCAGCGESSLGWEAASGRGTLISFAVLPAKDAEAEPGVLALVELDEGPWLHTRLAGEPAETGAGMQTEAGTARVVAGMRVVARFEHPDEGESYPLFWPE